MDIKTREYSIRIDWQDKGVIHDLSTVMAARAALINLGIREAEQIVVSYTSERGPVQRTYCNCLLDSGNTFSYEIAF